MSSFDVIIVGGGIAGASLGAMIAGQRRTAIIESEPHCGVHATGRSAAFWLASYGGPAVLDLSKASGPLLEAGWPGGDRSWLRGRGAIHLGSDRTDWNNLETTVMAADERAAWLGADETRALLPGLRAQWTRALSEPSCADIDVAALHQACLALFRRDGGTVLTGAGLQTATRSNGRWTVRTAAGDVAADIIVNSAGAWADRVAESCGIAPLGLTPKRRTMVQARVGRQGLAQLPLVIDAAGSFYFKGEAERSIWLSPHDETDCEAGDAAPTEIDIALAIDRFQSVVDWPVERVERSWAGLRTFAPDRRPIYGSDPATPSFFWCAGQGGFGIQTAPAAALLAKSLLLGEAPDQIVAHIDAAPFAPGRFDR
ncbi:FAD-binding oxidoreductase [Sphingomonas piscis]|uniref:FAD-binding oxidoreductase n=1 Tax=Sphingomonas piscis TaxID=2714943 RepID=A0A6G7YLU4_9SPHN|nr:FAD-dependent oxidoreductase [Sphingomonas piscis]QIK77713.1 FAD-binding oxidoreductase [Sphingomonas piscis]